MDLIWISAISGILLGTILSIVFGIYSKSSIESYSRSIFGMNSQDVIFNGIIFIIVASFIFLATVSAVVRDLTFPKANPINFTIETLLMAFLPALVFLAMPYLRGYKYTSNIALEFFVLALKFGALHILLQFSGFYSSIF